MKHRTSTNPRKNFKASDHHYPLSQYDQHFSEKFDPCDDYDQDDWGIDLTKTMKGRFLAFVFTAQVLIEDNLTGEPSLQSLEH